MKKAKLLRIAMIVLACLCVIAIGYGLLIEYTFRVIFAPTNAADNADVHRQCEMQQIILDAAELAPIPKTATIQFIRTEGNMFTRSFRLKFTDSDKAIKEWLAQSKGIGAAKLTEKGGIKQYIINTKCGYQYGEIQIDSRNHEVIVYVYKS